MRFFDKARFPPPGVFGSGATLLILALAVLSLQEHLAVALALGVPAVLLLGAEVLVVIKATRQGWLSGLEIRAYDLAGEIRALIEGTKLLVKGKDKALEPGLVPSSGDADVESARSERETFIVQSYEYRYSARARHLANEFRRTGMFAALAFADRVSQSPKTTRDVLEVAVTLEMLARQIREPIRSGD